MSEKYIKKIELRKSLLDQMKSHPAVFKAADMMLSALKNGNTILVFGNGGSATQASHFAAEMINKFYLKRKPIPAIALTDNCGNITSIANDFDFKYVFSKQVEALGKPGDIALGITTSGGSENVLEALRDRTGIGAWEPTRGRTADLTFLFPLADDQGEFLGRAIERGSVEVATDGEALAMTATEEFPTPDGGTTGQLAPKSFSGTRIVVEPMAKTDDG